MAELSPDSSSKKSADHQLMADILESAKDVDLIDDDRETISAFIRTHRAEITALHARWKSFSKIARYFTRKGAKMSSGILRTVYSEPVAKGGAPRGAVSRAKARAIQDATPSATATTGATPTPPQAVPPTTAQAPPSAASAGTDRATRSPSASPASASPTQSPPTAAQPPTPTAPPKPTQIPATQRQA